MQQNLNEVFIFPLRLKPIIKFDGNTLYGSKNVNDKFLKALSKSKKTKSSIPGLTRLINRGEIIPCYFEKTITRFVAWRIYKSKPIDIEYYDEVEKKLTKTTVDHLKTAHSIMGFYTPEYKKVILFVSNLSNIFSYTSNEFLADLTVHELCHKLATEKRSKFLSIFENQILSFYKELWTKIFQINKSIPDSIILKVVRLITKYESSNGQISNSELLKYFNELKILKIYSSLDEESFYKILTDYIVICKTFIKNMTVFFSKIKKYGHIITPIYMTYEKVFGITNNTTVCIQELIYPSEIIAIYSEHTSDNITKKIIDSF